MDKLKQYVVFTVLGCLVVLAAGWFLLVSPKRSDASALRAQTATKVSENSQLQNQLQILRAQAKDLPKQQAKLAAVAAKIPDNPALPGLVRALTAAGSAAGIELVSVTPGPPTAAVAATTAAGAPAAPAAPAGAASSAAGTLAAIPVSLSVVGSYFNIEQFMNAIENLPRSMRVSALGLAPTSNPVKPSKTAVAEDGRSLGATITGQVFMAANRPAATAVTVPGQAVAGTAVGPAAPVAPAKK